MELLEEERKRPKKSKEVKLSQLSSISGGGGGGGGKGAGNGEREMSRIECYQCGEKGHRKKDCPRKTEGLGGNGNFRKRKKPDDSLDY